MFFHRFSSAENRLLSYNVSDFRSPIRYNRRTARANAIVQTQGRMGGSDANIAGNQEAYADALNHLRTAGSVYDSAVNNRRATVNFGYNASRQIVPRSVSSASAQEVVANRNLFGGSAPRQPTRTSDAGEEYSDLTSRSRGASARTKSLRGQDARTRMTNAGVTENFIKHKQALAAAGVVPSGTSGGKVSAIVTPEQLQKLQEAGIVSGTGGIRQDGKFVAELNIDEQEWDSFQEPYEYIQSGQDLTDAEREEMDAANAVRQNRPTEITGEDFYEQPQDFTRTQSKLDKLDDLLTTLSPELRSIADFQISQFREQMAGLSGEANAMFGTFQTDEQIESSFQDQYTRAETTEQRFLSLADKNRELSERIATFNKDMLEIDKKMIEHNARVAESERRSQNIQQEKKLRRQLNALGIQTDIQGLNFLDNAILEGKKALENLVTANNLSILKASLAVSEGYKIDMQKAMDDHEAQYAQITAATDEKLDSIRNSISLAKSERDKEMRNAFKWMAEQKNVLESKLADRITGLNQTMISINQENKRLDRQLEKDKEAEERQFLRETAALSKEERSRSDSERKEKQKTISQITDDLQTREWYKAFKTSSASFKTAFETYQLYQDGKIEENAMQEAAGVLYAKMLDPTSVVRESEFERAAQGLGIKGVWQKVKDAVDGGRGFPPNLVESFITITEQAYNVRKDEALTEAIPLMRRIKDFNTDSEFGYTIDPLTIFPPDFLPVSDAAKNAADRIDDQASAGSGFLHDLALAHQRHEGFGTPQAVSINMNNNPGALRWHESQKSFGGVKPGARKPDGTTNTTGFTWFPDYDSGFSAMTADLNAKLTGKSRHIDYTANPTLLDYISVYAPSGDRNNPSSYANALVAELRSKGYNISVDTPLSVLATLV